MREKEITVKWNYSQAGEENLQKISYFMLFHVALFMFANVQDLYGHRIKRKVYHVILQMLSIDSWLK